MNDFQIIDSPLHLPYAPSFTLITTHYMCMLTRMAARLDFFLIPSATNYHQLMCTIIGYMSTVMSYTRICIMYIIM